MRAQSEGQASSPSEPALQPGTVIALGSVLCRAEGLGSTAFNARQGPHFQWQPMYQLGLYGHTAGHQGKHPAPSLVCNCQEPICSSQFVGSVGHRVAVSLELSACGRHVTSRWLQDLVTEESTQPNVPTISVPNSTGTGSLLPFCKIQQLAPPLPI